MMLEHSTWTKQWSWRRLKDTGMSVKVKRYDNYKFKSFQHILCCKCRLLENQKNFYIRYELNTVYINSIINANLQYPGLHSPLVQARLAIFTGDLASAEECYTKKAGQPELAIQMYKQFNRWTEAIAVAEKIDRSVVAELKQQHMDYLISTGEVYFRL